AGVDIGAVRDLAREEIDQLDVRTIGPTAGSCARRADEEAFAAEPAQPIDGLRGRRRHPAGKDHRPAREDCPQLRTNVVEQRLHHAMVRSAVSRASWVSARARPPRRAPLPPTVVTLAPTAKHSEITSRATGERTDGAEAPDRLGTARCTIMIVSGGQRRDP